MSSDGYDHARPENLAYAQAFIELDHTKDLCSSMIVAITTNQRKRITVLIARLLARLGKPYLV